MKRRIALYIACILVFNLVFPFFEDFKVFGANDYLNVSFTNGSLTEGTRSDTPVYSNLACADGDTFMSWKIGINKRYELRFFIDNATEIVFTVWNDPGNNLQIDYKKLSYTHYPTSSTGALMTDQKLYVYQLGAATKYIPASAYGLNPTDPTATHYIREIKGPDHDDQHATFGIPNNDGASIKYGDNQYTNDRIHFLWSNGEFKFQTNMLSSDRIYDIKLYDLDSGDIYDRNVITGINTNLSTFSMVPISNGYTDTETGEYVFNTTDDFANNNDYQINTGDFKARLETNPLELYTTDDKRDNYPTANHSDLKNGIIYTFDLPKALDDTKKYNLIPDNVDMSATIELSYYATDPNTNSKMVSKMTIELDNIYADTHNLATDVRTPNSIKAQVYRKLDNNKIQLLLTGFDSGMLFDTTITMSAKDYVRKSSRLGFASYTFMKYNVHPGDTHYYIQFEPYPYHTGTYTLYINQDNTSSKELTSASAYKKYTSSSQETTFTLSLRTDSEDVTLPMFQLGFKTDEVFELNRESNWVYSQQIKYKPDPNDVTLTIPDDFSVSHKLTPAEPNMYDKGILNLNLNWSIATATVLDKLTARYVTDADEGFDIVYKLNSSLTPYPSSDTLENYADVVVSIRKKDSVFEYRIKKIIYYDKHDDDDIAKTITDNNWYALELGSNGKYKIKQELTLTAAKEPANETVPYIYFIYPNVYFFNLQIAEIGTDLLPDRSTDFVSDTLNQLGELEMPPPQNVSVTKDDTTALDKLGFSLSGSQMKQYMDYTFPTALSSDIDKMSFNVYISTNKDLFFSNNFLEGDSTRALRQNASVVALYDKTLSNDHLYFSEVTNSVTSSTTLNVNGYKDPLAALRDGKVVMIKDIKLSPSDIDRVITDSHSIPKSFTLDGLDPNQLYYVLVDLWVDVTIEDVPVERNSPLSAIDTFTTGAVKEEAGDDEKSPQAPEFTGEKEVLANKATIYWNRIPTPLQDEKIEFEIVRISNSLIADQFLNTGAKDGFSVFWNTILENYQNTDLKGYRTDGTTVSGYDPAKGFTVAVTDYEYDRDVVSFTSMGLAPNQVYFYCVRTVRTVRTADGWSEPTYSVWSQTSITTSPVQRPENLRTEKDFTKYNAKTEVMLVFDVPFTNMNDFSIEYIIREGTGEWSSEKTPTTTINTAPHPTQSGYLVVSFIVPKLKSNTGYSFMVRLIDNKTGDKSMYSSSLSTRTDFDQTDYDNQNDESKWLDYLKTEIGSMLKQYYWLADNTTSLYTAIYRPSMFDTLVSQSINGQLQLAGSDKNASALTYYLPASALISANESNKGFVITSDNMQIVLPKNTFDPSSNAAIQDVLRQIEAKKLTDYMVKISVNMSPISTVDGNEAASKQARISFELIGLSISNNNFDALIPTLITNKINDDSTFDDFKGRLTYMIERNYTKEQIQNYAEDTIAKVAIQITNDISAQLAKSISRRVSLITLNAPMIISHKSDDTNATIKGYVSSGSTWSEQEVTNMGDRIAMTSSLPGIYVFAKSVLNLVGLENIPGSNNIKAVIAKYGLTDFLGNGSAFDVNAPATANMVAGIVSRICGAPKGTDPLVYLRNKGVSVSTRNQYSSISNQESVYLMMYLYENKTNTKISTITIRNFAATANISGIDERYKKSIQVAFELGVCTDRNMNVANSATAKDVLKMLEVLNSKLKF